MTHETLTEFFKWCTIINGGLIVISTIMFIALQDFAYGLHRKWFKLSRETFDAIIYSYLGLYKLVVIVFNLVPWLVLASMK